MRKIYLLWSKVLFLLLLTTGIAFSQTNVTGKVTDARTGEGIAGVNVIVKGTSTGTVTNVDGDFTIAAPANATLQFSFIGYLSEEVVVTGDRVEVQLSEDIMNLEEVVISGLATSVKRTNLANSVASVSAQELTAISNQQTLDAALYGKFKGANITANSGAPGGGLSMRLRGLTSINGSNEPLYVIDGIYLDNSSIAGGLNVVSQAAGGGSQSNQDNPSNRLADIDPEDIETVEVLKGASAAAIYGSRASGGVVIITTKKGKQGKPDITLAQSVGVAKMLNPLGVRSWNDQKVEDAFGVGEVPVYQAAKAAGKIYNYEDELFGNDGLLINTRLSVSGGNEKTKYFVGATRKSDEGIIENTGYDKTSLRVNLDQKLADWLDLSVTTNYITSSADRGFFNNDNSGTTMGISYVGTPSWADLFPDAQGNYPANPYSNSNFLETRDRVTNNESVERFISGGTITAKLFTNETQGLKLMVSGGLDYYTLYTKAIFPNTLQFQSNGNGLNGVSVQGTTQNRNTNVSAFLVHDYFPAGSSFSFRTQLGVTQQDFDQNNILVTASNMIGSQTNVDQAGTVASSQNRILQQDKGFFAQEEVNYSDKVIATFGVRGDKSSNNGDVNKLYYYPKASLAVNISEFSFWNVEQINQLKVRMAYGQAGNFAVFGSKYTSFGGIVIDGSSGSQIITTLGNDEVEPERQSELEFGFDIALMQNKISLDATYYIKTVEDLLLNARVPNSTGFTTQVTNAADMQNKGFEIGLDLNLVNNKEITWTSRTSFWKNTGEVTRLDVPTFTTGGFADFLGQFRIKEGHSPTEIIGVGPNPDEDGYVVFGNAEPDFQMSFYNMVTWKGFEFAMMWHWKKGGENINLTALLSDLSGTSFDYDKIDLDPSGTLGNGPYRLGELGVNTGPYIEDAGYLRMREIGLYYNLPKSLISKFAKNVKVGFSGNNLINFFDYRSYDPEVSNFGSGGLSTGVEVTPFPSAKRMNFHVIFKF